MASSLEYYVNHKKIMRIDDKSGGGILHVTSVSSLTLHLGTVSVITADGRNIVGTLKGFDQTINIILDESHERVYSTSHGVEQVVLGLYIIRGDNIAVIGELDEELDSRLDFTNIKAEPLNPVVH